MKTIKVKEDFVAYPSGKKREFRKGEEVEVPAADADLYAEKGHATVTGSRAAAHSSAESEAKKGATK